MLYIHQTTCISPQQTFTNANIDLLHGPVNNMLRVIEPVYKGIPQSALRRIAKSTRIGVGAALSLIQQQTATSINGIIIGTANAGMEESIQFVKQITDHEEGMLAPGAFVQSTPNTIASQISLLSNNKGYNNTHVHRGLAFENALLDAVMLLKENPLNTYLLGGVDEIGSCNYNIDYLAGWYKKEPLAGKQLYEVDSAGSIAGEGAALFLVNNQKENAVARVRALKTLHSDEEDTVRDQLQYFIDTQVPAGEKIDLLLSGENGDNRLAHFFSSCERIFDAETPIARFKHMSGEYPTDSAFALWLACYLPTGEPLPPHMIKRLSVKTKNSSRRTDYKNILIYNNHKGVQHSFILVSKTG
jgi:hypothetical protein